MKANEAEKAMEKYLATCGFLDFAGFEVSHPERRANAAAWWVLQGIRAGIIEEDERIPDGTPWHEGGPVPGPTWVKVPAGTIIRLPMTPYVDDVVFTEDESLLGDRPDIPNSVVRRHPAAGRPKSNGNGDDVA